MKPEVVTYHVIANANFTPCCVTGRIVEGKMADASNVSGAHGLDLHETRKRLEVLDKNYRNLKGLSQKAVIEFEELQNKCQEYFEKYKEQETKYLKVKGDLEKLKDVSNLALSEYENLHGKFEVEQSCRNKAEEFATNMVQENKNLKRHSQLLISQVSSIGQVNLEELSNLDDFTTDDRSDNAVLHEEIKELKGLVESLRKEVKGTKEELTATQNQLNKEKHSHEATKKRLFSNEKQFKQLNRVSVLALEEYSTLQQKYALESHCRFEAEKYAAEVVREKDVLDRQRKFISETTGKDEQLKKALEEISALNKKLAEERTESEEKVRNYDQNIDSPY
ncbi:hypothetical protein OS493_017183 [Desmophyllum pertusum]|uniref:Shootin-1 n=1 Tax=Desmophyllum pertusum TaxID=174260 RepID=A0A9X0CEF3_9CNID|nr:hypothetical protein OS493_017183 [Desmophyllum pertusum]